jgi:hypothetical protein
MTGFRAIRISSPAADTTAGDEEVPGSPHITTYRLAEQGWSPGQLCARARGLNAKVPGEPWLSRLRRPDVASMFALRKKSQYFSAERKSSDRRP